MDCEEQLSCAFIPVTYICGCSSVDCSDVNESEGRTIWGDVCHESIGWVVDGVLKKHLQIAERYTCTSSRCSSNEIPVFGITSLVHIFDNNVLSYHIDSYLWTNPYLT